jgi:hypothetical protein
MRFIFILAIIFIISCEKKDTTKPVISISLPKYNDTFSVGIDTIPYKFMVTDEDQLMNVSFVIKDSSNTKFASGNRFVNSKEFNLLDSNVYGGFGGIQKISLIVQAYDKSYNHVEATQIFYIRP